MIKRCTNSACRREFNASMNAKCPYCGKSYPRGSTRYSQSWLVLSGVLPGDVHKLKATKLLLDICRCADNPDIETKYSLQYANDIIFSVLAGSAWVVELPAGIIKYGLTIYTVPKDLPDVCMLFESFGIRASIIPAQKAVNKVVCVPKFSK